MFASTFANADFPITRTPEEAAQLHQIAGTNLAHVAKKLRAHKEVMDLGSVYLGKASATCAPPNLDLHYIFSNFNDIGRGGFVAHPSLPIEMNGAIFCYGIDQGQSAWESANETYTDLV
jgi:hypothetical protein